MFILKKGHQPGVYVPLRALFLVLFSHENACSSTYYLFWLLDKTVIAKRIKFCQNCDFYHVSICIFAKTLS